VTEPIRVGELLPGVVAEAIARAGPGYDRWMELVAQTGYCAHPVRLRGTVDHVDTETGEIRTVYSTDREPDAALRQPAGVGLPVVFGDVSGRQLPAPGRRAARRPGCPETVRQHPSRRRRSATSTAARPKGCWCSPAVPTGRARPVRTASERAAGSATTNTTRGWVSRCVPAAIRLAPRCYGTPWPGDCGHGRPFTSIGRWPSSLG
jgi:hypothetical protein